MESVGCGKGAKKFRRNVVENNRVLQKKAAARRHQFEPVDAGTRNFVAIRRERMSKVAHDRGPIAETTKAGGKCTEFITSEAASADRGAKEGKKFFETKIKQ